MTETADSVVAEINAKYHAFNERNYHTAVALYDYAKSLERKLSDCRTGEQMTPENIKKLPTPETDALETERNGTIVEALKARKLARSLEQRLAAAVMALDRAMRISDLSLDKEVCETLTSIRSMK